MEDEIIHKIAELAAMEPNEVHPDCSLKELGIDSLMVIELVVFIERMVKRQFPEERMGLVKTCGDVLRELKRLTQPAAAPLT